MIEDRVAFVVTHAMASSPRRRRHGGNAQGTTLQKAAGGKSHSGSARENATRTVKGVKAAGERASSVAPSALPTIASMHEDGMEGVRGYSDAEGCASASGVHNTLDVRDQKGHTFAGA